MELAALVELFLVRGFLLGGGFGGREGVGGWGERGEGSGDERAGGEEAFGDALEGFLFDVEDAGLVEFVFFALAEELEGCHCWCV